MATREVSISPVFTDVDSIDTSDLQIWKCVTNLGKNKDL